MQKDIRRRHEANRRAQAICEQNRGVIETNDGGKKALSRFSATVDGVDVLLADQEQARNDRQKARADLEVERRTLRDIRSEEHTSELQSRGLISYAVFCLKKKKT